MSQFIGRDFDRFLDRLRRVYTVKLRWTAPTTKTESKCPVGEDQRSDIRI